MAYRWTASPKLNDQKIEQLAESINVSNSIAALLLQRGIETYEQAKKFFRPQLTDLYDPFLMKDMDKAVDRIKQAIFNKERFLIYGDYDVDGTTSVSIVYSFFKKLTSNIEYYIPDRYKEGYGVSRIGIDYAVETGVNLIIALDCGTRSIELIQYAKEKGIDFIVCDHHLPGDELPDAIALLNPKRKDCEYPYKELSGCGIGFKLLQAYAQASDIQEEEAYKYLDLVAVSTCSDIVDMRDENRVLVYYGLKKINDDPCIGLQALLQSYQIKQEYDVSDIVFGIGPKINAAGRIADAKSSVKLLIEEDFHQALMLAKTLNENNTERKDIDNDITKEAMDILETSEALRSRNSTVLYSEKWHKGVIGIVASRLIETYYKPTIIFSEVNGMLTGSARSIKDFDVHEAIGACGDLVIQYGGHKYAAGLTILKESFEAFTNKFEEIVTLNSNEELRTPEIEYDMELNFDDITSKFFNVLNQFRPHGPGNMIPIFRTNNLVDSGSRIVKEKHLKLVAYQKGIRFDGIAFNMSDFFPIISSNAPFDICYSIEMNEFKGNKNLQLKVRDIRTSL
ncbi:MAG: single-stranded-DNA-specific exonuclease RecJ [Bacteroidia bacterium]|nr:single-stranded-DNA-specific exonuclease RecJ [Bacteroidia bacterium]